MALIAVSLVAVACGSDDNNENDNTATATSDPPPAETTTTSAEPTSTTVPTEGPEEWVEVVRDIYDRDWALLENPDPDAVEDVYARTCDCWQASYDTVQLLAEGGDHVEGQRQNILAVRHEDTISAGAEFHDLVVLTVEIQANDMQIVDAAGEAVQEFPAGEGSSCKSLSIAADGPDGAYRIHSQLELRRCPPGG